MISKAAIVPLLLYFGATIIIFTFSFRVLVDKGNQKEGLFVLSLNLENTRRDLLGSVQGIASKATQLAPAITSAAAGVASQAPSVVSNVISNAAALETAAIGQVLDANYTVGTKYACAASSCHRIPSLEVILCFGLSITVISAATFALAFFMPSMKLFTLGCSMFALLFFIVFAACVVSIVEIASLLGSTVFHFERGRVFAESLWILCAAIVVTFSLLRAFFISPWNSSKQAVRSDGPSRAVPTWARRMRHAQFQTEIGEVEGRARFPSDLGKSSQSAESTIPQPFSEQKGA